VLCVGDEVLLSRDFCARRWDFAPRGQTPQRKTVPVALAEFIGWHSVNWGMLVTGGFIASLPPIILSLAFYHYIVAGLSAGGLKG
jgi:multiple sugar transport system permease protein